MYATFEIRQKNLTKARKTLVGIIDPVNISACMTTNLFAIHILKGLAIGKYPKNKLFKGYIGLEIQLREVDRCRKLYEKYIEFDRENCMAWIEVIIREKPTATMLYL